MRLDLPKHNYLHNFPIIDRLTAESCFAIAKHGLYMINQSLAKNKIMLGIRREEGFSGWMFGNEKIFVIMFQVQHVWLYSVIMMYNGHRIVIS